jgi:hypothetical protein
LLAVERVHGGETYFVAADDTTIPKDFMNNLLTTRVIQPMKRSAPFALASRMATLMEAASQLSGIKSKPPEARQMFRMISQNFTLNISKARRELGYVPVTTRALTGSRLYLNVGYDDGCIRLLLTSRPEPAIFSRSGQGNWRIQPNALIHFGLSVNCGSVPKHALLRRSCHDNIILETALRSRTSRRFEISRKCRGATSSQQQ